MSSKDSRKRWSGGAGNQEQGLTSVTLIKSAINQAAQNLWKAYIPSYLCGVVTYLCELSGSSCENWQRVWGQGPSEISKWDPRSAVTTSSGSLLCTCAESFLLSATQCDSMDCSPSGCSAPGDSPGKNPRVAHHALLQGISRAPGSNPSESLLGNVNFSALLQTYKSETVKVGPAACSPRRPP